MLARRITPFAFVASTILFSVANADSQVFAKSDVLAMEEFLREQFAETDYGVVVGLVDENGSKVISAGQLGDAANQCIDGNTVFEIGSVTKTFTSLLLMEMADRGELKLDDPVATYLPGSVKLPTHGDKSIKLLNLAVQDSGLPFNGDNHIEGTWWEGFNAYAAKDMYAFLSRHRLNAEPGTAFQYSNLGMSLLGHALERCADEDFESLVLKRICVPLGMNDTRVTLNENMKSRLAVGHDARGERTPYYDFKVMQPAGSLYSTANDMLKFVSAQLGFSQTKLSPLMQQTHVQRHESSNVGNTAMPWYDHGVYVPTDSRFLGHAGGTIGFSAFIGFDTHLRRGVVVLTNQRIEKSNQRIWHATCLGWSVLQQLPPNLEHASQLVREVVGFGFALAIDEATGLIRIQTVYPKSPAGRAGLEAGQLVQKINGISVKGRTMAKCFEMMRGPAGTLVRLEIRGGKNEARVVELRKDKFLTSHS